MDWDQLLNDRDNENKNTASEDNVIDFFIAGYYVRKNKEKKQKEKLTSAQLVEERQRHNAKVLVNYRLNRSKPDGF
jgi:hypothetical protein